MLRRQWMRLDILNLKVVEEKRRQVQLQGGEGGTMFSSQNACCLQRKIKDAADKGGVEVCDERRPSGAKQSGQLHGQGPGSGWDTAASTGPEFQYSGGHCVSVFSYHRHDLTSQNRVTSYRILCFYQHGNVRKQSQSRLCCYVHLKALNHLFLAVKEQ